MAGPLFFDRVQESSTITGTGTYTLTGANTNFQAWSVVGNGNTAYYMATDGTNWEVGLGTYTLSGTTLARTTILESSNSNAAVSWPAGTKTVSLVEPASWLTSPVITGALTLQASAPGQPYLSSAKAFGTVPVYQLEAFGADGTAANDLAAWNAIKTLAAGGSAVIVIGPGKFNFASPLTWTYSGTNVAVTVVGSGADTTILNWTAGNGFNFSLSDPSHSFHFHDFALSTANSSTTNGITVSQSSPLGAFHESDVCGINFRGDTLISQGWSASVKSNGVSGINFDNNSFIYGAVGVDLEPSATTPFAALTYNFSNCAFYGQNFFCIEYGSYIQAVQVVNCSFVNVATGIFANSGLSGFLEGLEVTGSQFAGTSNLISISTAIASVNITGNLFTSSAGQSNTMVLLNQANNFSITGNNFYDGANKTMGGINIGTTASNSAGVISGNTFTGLGTPITLGASSSNILVDANAFANNNSGITNTGVSNPLVEYDTKAFYATVATSSKQVIDAEQVTILSADNTTPTNVATAQNVFPTGQGTLTVQGSTTYEFEALYEIDTAGTTSNSLQTLFGGTATFTSIGYLTSATNGTNTSPPAAASCRYAVAATAINVTAAIAAATNRQVYLRGTMRINAAGTVIPQFQYSAAPGSAPVVRANSFFRCWAVGSNTVTSVGNWS